MGELIQNVLLALVDPPGQAHRDMIDPDAVRELAESIREKGLLQPVILRPVNGRFEVVAGHRRYLAHRFLGLTEIPAMVREMSDADMTIIRAIENLQRENLNPIEEAKAYRLMMDEGGLSRNDVARKVGKAPVTVDKYTQLLRLPQRVQDALSRKQISMDVAHTLGQLDDDVMLEYYLKMAVENGVTNSVVRVWVEDYFKSKEGNLYEGSGSDPLGSVVVEPTKNYTACNVCQDPVEIAKAIHLIICPGCRERVRTLRQSK
jgi:ParB family chromosome partitioning protein